MPIDVTELAIVLDIPIDDADLDALKALWSLYRFGLVQMETELEGSEITSWMGLEVP